MLIHNILPATINHTAQKTRFKTFADKRWAIATPMEALILGIALYFPKDIEYLDSSQLCQPEVIRAMSLRFFHRLVKL